MLRLQLTIAVVTAPLTALKFVAGKINPIFAQDFGCPAVGL